jgi:hypothetical protein
MPRHGRGDQKAHGFDRWARCLALAALTAICALISVSGSAVTDGTVGGPLLGVNMHPLQDNYAVASPADTLELARSIGASVVRIDIHWGWIEYLRPGRASWYMPQIEQLDAFLAQAAHDNIRVLATVLDTPCWALDEPGKRCPPEPPHYRGSYPPRSPGAYADFLRRLAAHVRGRIQYYEIWNEPNLRRFWHHPDPAAYTRLLRAAYRAIKSEDPAAQVLAGATSGADVRFVAGMYAAGARGSFDALSIHPYSGNRPPDTCSIPRRSFACGVEAVRQVMIRHGDTRPIWLTEFGIPVSAHVSTIDQAHYLTEVASFIKRWSYVRGVIWYELYDDPTGHDGQHYGLFDAALQPRPAAAAFRRLTTESVTPEPAGER